MIDDVCALGVTLLQSHEEDHATGHAICVLTACMYLCIVSLSLFFDFFWRRAQDACGC